MKFTFKLLHKLVLPWVNWFFQHYSLDFEKKPHNPSYLWKIVNKQLSSLRNISFVLTNNGTSTFLWLDAWLLPTPLADTYPHLVSHSTSPSVMVSHVMHNGLLATLRNRLTNVASAELASVLSLLQDVTTSNAPDDRFLTHGSSFTSRCAYSLLSSDHELDLNAGHIWGSKAPIKVRIFGWLLCRDRLSTMANLHRKTISSHSDCPRCDFTHEAVTHLTLLCPCAAQVWSLLGLQPPHFIDLLWDTTTPVGLDINIWPNRRPLHPLKVASTYECSCLS